MNNPLFLPEGSIRSLLALGFVGSFCYMSIMQMNVSTVFVGFVGAVVGFYFGSRQNKKKEGEQ